MRVLSLNWNYGARYWRAGVAEPCLLTGRYYNNYYIHSAAYQSGFRKCGTSRNTPTRTMERSLTLSLKFCHGNSLFTSPFTVHLQYMYTCIVGRESTLAASWVVIVETALRQCMRQRLLWDSRSRKSKKRSLLPLRRDMMSL